MAEQEPLLEVIPTRHCPEHCDAAVALLEEQWPHEKAIRANRLKSMTEFLSDNLRCHFVLLLSDPSAEDREKTVIGHSLLQQADGRSDGKSAVMFSVVIHKDLRGKGYGRILMRETERYALMQGYSHMYLSTEDQQGFYHRLGYQECEPITSLGKNSKRLTPNQVEALEDLFARRVGVGTAPKSGNTWMKKRLIEEYPMQDPYPKEKLAKHVCYTLSGDCRADEEGVKSYGLFVSVPWQQQAGPSCGLVTVSMVAQAVKSHPGLSESGVGVEPCACTGPLSEEPCSGEVSQSLLQVASRLGISRDGEVFCAYNLAFLAHKTHQLAMEVQSTGPETVAVILSNLALGKPCIIPYDRSVANHQPTLAEGTRAHWAIITGLVVIPPADGVPPSELSAVKWSTCHEMEDGTSCKLVECAGASKPEGSEIVEKLLGESEWESQVVTTYAICVHGMSKTPFVCSLKSLFESNANLRKAKSAHVKAPVDLEHLRNKFIMIA